MSRREYKTDIVVNEIRITKIIIDPHYELKHSASITDQLILELVNRLNGRMFDIKSSDSPYFYFAEEIILRGKNYKLVWLLEDQQMYIGVVNAYRRK
jgi:hypothetical protein